MKTYRVLDIYELLGLIKDSKAPNKINIRGNIFDSYSCSSIECYYRSFNGTNWLDDIDIRLEDEVEILDEEDEFIDIEEISLKLMMTNYDRTENIINLNYDLQVLTDSFNDLIKNQKKIIERINKDE